VCQCGRSIAAEEFAAGEYAAAVADPEQYDAGEERFASEPVVDVTKALDAAARAERLAQLRPARRTIVLLEPKAPERLLEPGEWRREVSSRVSRYRARRRPRQERSRSLSLNFEPAPPSLSAPTLPTFPEVAAAQPSTRPEQPIGVLEPLPGTAELMAMEIEAYGVERYWPKTAPPNQNPFWKRVTQAVPTEAIEPVGLQSTEAVPSETMDDRRESPAVSHQVDGSTVADLTSDLSEAMSDDEPGSMEERSERILMEFRSVLQEAAPGGVNCDSRQNDEEAAPLETMAAEFTPPEEREELAEPPAVLTRVFEADEISQFGADAEASVEPAPPIATVDLPAVPGPVQTLPAVHTFAPIAPVYLRVIAEATDGAISFSGVLLFSSILMWLGAMPQGRAFTMFAAIMPGFFWSLYQYLFLVNAGSTPGMRLTGLELSGFDERMVTRQRRRARALSMCISTLAAGLGFIWALLDIDHLCWHDRSSRTFLTRR
jgi:hypothetical protein